jgi:peroxiredoxin
MAGARATTARAAALALAVATVAALTACSSGGGTSGEPAAVPSTSTATATAGTGRAGTTTSTGAPAPATSGPATSEPASPSISAASVPAVLQFRATTVDGAAFSGADLAGRKTVLWFWAPWCTVCARAAADVKSAATTLGPDVRVVGVAGLSSDAADMQRFVDRGGLQSLTNLADATGDVYARFAVTQQDTFVLIQPDGTVSRHPSYSQDVDLVSLARQTFG